MNIVKDRHIVMSLKNELIWLKGKRILICELNLQRLSEKQVFLKKYGIEVEAISTIDELLVEIEKRRYATHRVYILAIIEIDIAEQMEAVWQQVTYENPMILGTPLALLYEQPGLRVKRLLGKKFFRFSLQKPLSEDHLMKLLGVLNRWKVLQQELQTEACQSAVILGGKS